MTAATKHTPTYGIEPRLTGQERTTAAPWLITYDADCRDTVIRRPDGSYIALVFNGRFEDGTEGADNARLIANAPRLIIQWNDLLAALRATDDLLADLLDACESKQRADAIRHCQAFIAPILRKATGETP